METETILILLFVVVTAVAIAVQRLAIPYTVALVVRVHPEFSIENGKRIQCRKGAHRRNGL
jgi:hypothetical protein